MAGDLAAAAARRTERGPAVPALAAGGRGNHIAAGRLGHHHAADRGHRMKQRGVILISALVITAMAAVVAAALFYDTGLLARRAMANFGLEQALQIGQGAEALAAQVLREDTGQTDTPADSWAQAVDPVEVQDGVVLEARLTDEVARFNLNSLVNADGEHDENAVRVFKRLLELVELEPRWADMVAEDRKSTCLNSS